MSSWGPLAASSAAKQVARVEQRRHAERQTDDQIKAELAWGMHDVFAGDLMRLHGMALQLQNDVPTPSGRGWTRPSPR